MNTLLEFLCHQLLSHSATGIARNGLIQLNTDLSAEKTHLCNYNKKTAQKHAFSTLQYYNKILGTF